MGYYTDYNGWVGLDKPLTEAQEKEVETQLLKNYFIPFNQKDEIEENMDEPDYLSLTDNQTFEIFDSMKDYDYMVQRQLVWICKFCNKNNLVANGGVFWKGEEWDDVGEYDVKNNVISVKVIDWSLMPKREIFNEAKGIEELRL